MAIVCSYHGNTKGEGLKCGRGTLIFHMPRIMATVKVILLALQVYTSIALPRAYPNSKESRGESISVVLRQAACSNPSQCLPEEFRNISAPTDLVNCTDGVCTCNDCFTVTGSTCTIRQCWSFENGSCVDGRTRSQQTATLLSAFLSSVGAANFYIGRNDLGAGQLVLFVILAVIIAASIVPCCLWYLTRNRDGEATDEYLAGLCPACCCEDYITEEGDMSFNFFFFYGSINICLFVLTVLPIAVWWLADLIIFATNQRLDGNGCPLI